MEKRTVWEDLGFKRDKRTWLTNAEYKCVVDTQVIFCADVLVVHPDLSRQLVYLAPRQTYPAPGWWMIGGRVSWGQRAVEAACAHFKRDVGVDLKPERLVFQGNLEYMFRLRAQAPQDDGTHTVSATYVFQPTCEELARLSACVLSNDVEYRQHASLCSFARQQLQDEVRRGMAHPAIFMAYDLVFPYS